MLIKVLMTLHCRKAKYSSRKTKYSDRKARSSSRKARCSTGKARYSNCNLAFYLEIAKA